MKYEAFLDEHESSFHKIFWNVTVMLGLLSCGWRTVFDR